MLMVTIVLGTGAHNTVVYIGISPRHELKLGIENVRWNRTEITCQQSYTLVFRLGSGVEV